MDYVNFASKISFFEFLQDEFKKPHFDSNNYQKEIDILKAGVTIDHLTKVLEANPSIFLKNCSSLRGSPILSI